MHRDIRGATRNELWLEESFLPVSFEEWSLKFQTLQDVSTTRGCSYFHFILLSLLFLSSSFLSSLLRPFYFPFLLNLINSSKHLHVPFSLFISPSFYYSAVSFNLHFLHPFTFCLNLQCFAIQFMFRRPLHPVSTDLFYNVL